jgi:hypothetical protein
MDNDVKNAKRRYRRRLAKSLVLSAEVVCESLDKEPKRAQEALSRLMRAVIELSEETKINEEKREDLIQHLRDCAYGAAAYVERDDESVNLVVVEGTFDLKKLSKRMVWYGYQEAAQQELTEIRQCR